jgi:hypothetical protein
MSGNPRMRSRDPEARRQIAETNKKKFLERLKETSGIWLPIVQKMRPSNKWIEVLQAVNEVTGEQWTEARLRRSVRQLVDAGLADPVLFEPAPRSYVSSDAIAVIRDMLQADLGISVRRIASQLDSMGIATGRGSARWGTGSVHKILKRLRDDLEGAER